MSFCVNCGKEISEGEHFCSHCGTKVEADNLPSLTTGHILIKCISCGISKLAKIKVIIDKTSRGELTENGQISIPLTYGDHDVELKISGNKPLHFKVLIDEKNPEVVLPFKLKMGEPVFAGETLDSEVFQLMKSKKPFGGKVVSLLSWLIILVVFLLIITTTNKSTSSESSINQESKETSMTSSDNKGETKPAPIAKNNYDESVKEPSFSPITSTVGNWDVSINDFSYMKNLSTGILSEYRAEDNSIFCIINITAKNCGKEADTFLPYLVYGDMTTAKIKWKEYEYLRSIVEYYDENLLSEVLNPLVSTTGDLVFEVPLEMMESDIIPVLEIAAGKSVFECSLIKQ